MASNSITRAAFFLTLNLLFFTLVTSTHIKTVCPPPPPAPKCPPPPPAPKCPPPTTPTPIPPTPKTPTPKPPTPKTPTPIPPTPKTPTPKPPTPKTPTPKPPTPKTPTPSPIPEPPTTPPTQPKEQCPKDTLKLGVCANLLNDLVHLVVGTPASSPCCSLIGGLADLEAAVCLCTAIKVGVLGVNLNIPVDLSLLLNYCGKKAPTGFQCG